MTDTIEEEKRLYDVETSSEQGRCFYDSFTDPDWRRKRRNNNIMPNAAFRARFGGNRRSFYNKNETNNQEWKNARVAAKHLKFCPGERCKTYLPLYEFGSNWNMEDNFDIYCIKCNQMKRVEKQSKRKSSEVVHDSFKVFKQMKTSQLESEENKMREVFKRIDLASVEAKGRFKREIPADPEEICKKLFGSRKYTCNVTKEPLTPECFLEHHSITFEVRERADKKKVLDIICSDCCLSVEKTLPSPAPKTCR